MTAIRWARSEEGHVASKCGRFHIHPEYHGTTSPQGYRCHDEKTGQRWSGDTQRDLKGDCENVLSREKIT